MSNGKSPFEIRLGLLKLAQGIARNSVHSYEDDNGKTSEYRLSDSTILKGASADDIIKIAQKLNSFVSKDGVYAESDFKVVDAPSDPNVAVFNLDGILKTFNPDLALQIVDQSFLKWTGWNDSLETNRDRITILETIVAAIKKEISTCRVQTRLEFLASYIYPKFDDVLRKLTFVADIQKKDIERRTIKETQCEEMADEEEKLAHLSRELDNIKKEFANLESGFTLTEVSEDVTEQDCDEEIQRLLEFFKNEGIDGLKFLRDTISDNANTLENSNIHPHVVNSMTATLDKFDYILNTQENTQNVR